MDTPKLIIQIPEPCHEDWNKMQTEATGKFCSSCSKSVIDFSNKTDIEIQKYFIEHRGQNICGRFKKTQVNRPLKITYHLKDLPKNVSITKAFAIAAFLAFGTFLFSCTDEQGKKIDAIEISKVETESRTLGIIMQANAENIDKDSNSLNKVAPTKQVKKRKHYKSGNVQLEEIQVIAYTVPLIDTYVAGASLFIEKEDDVMVSLAPTCEIGEDSSSNNITFEERVAETNISEEISMTAFPNPNNGDFMVKYSVTTRANVVLDIFNEQGALIRTLVNVPNQYEGKYQIPVNLIDFSNGVYFVNLIIGKERTTQKIIIEK